MVTFLIAAAIVASAAAALIVGRAAGASRGAAQGEDPAVAVYRRQLDEVDDLADRGLLDAQDRRQALSEAGRRLLSATRETPATPAPSRRAGQAVALTAGAAALVAIALYMAFGAPGAPDDPFKPRLAQWQAIARTDPQTLNPAQMAAVLEDAGRNNPNDPRLFAFLGRARLAAGDGYGAVEALRRASALAPRDVDTLLLLGQAQAALETEGRVSSDAEASFRRALALDPANAEARYAVAQTQIMRGDTAQGLAGWRALLASLTPDDPRRDGLSRQIAETQSAAQPGAGAQAIAANPQAEMIQGMVDRQAARLRDSPDDPAGWARLVRSYGVLGQPQKQAEALDAARRLFAGRPKDLAIVEAEAPD